MKKKTRYASPEKVFGKETHWGATRHPDGSLELCDSYAAPFQALMDRERGLARLAVETNKFLAAEFARMAKESREWWAKMTAEFDLDIEKYDYSFEGRTIRRAEKKPETPAASQGWAEALPER